MKSTILSFFIALCSLSFTSQAQVTLSGALTGNYPTLAAAFNAINNGGGSDTVTVTITEDHALTTTAILQQTGYTVTIQPSGNRTISGSMNAPLILFNGADNATLDGIAISGPNTLTISNASTGNVASALRLSNDASNNIIRYCTFQGSSQGAGGSNGVVNITTPSLGTTGCDNNQIIHNHIREAGANLPQNGMVMEGGSSSVLNNNNVISDNHIYNFFSPNSSTWFSCGVFSYRYNTGTTLNNNHFYQTAPRTGSTGAMNLRAIEIDDGGYAGSVGGFSIHNNFIGGSAPNAEGAPLTLTHPSNIIVFMGILLAQAMPESAVYKATSSGTSA